MIKLTLPESGRPLKLPPNDLLELFQLYKTTRISKSDLASRFNISRVTLDFYIQNLDAIKAEAEKALVGLKKGEGANPIAAEEAPVNTCASQDAMQVQDSTNAEAA